MTGGTKAWITLAAILLALSPPHWAGAAELCPAIPPRAPMPREAQAAIVDQPYWRAQVAALDGRLAAESLATRQLVFIGDSITASWDPGVFSQFYDGRAPLLLGVGGDYTQGLLQRLPAEWGPLRPRLAVLLIGTNNTKWAGSQPGDVALGIAEIIRMIHAQSPGTRVLELGILPTGASPSDPLRAVDAQVNQLVAQCADNQTVFYLDPGRALLGPDGRLSDAMSYDMLHLTPAGYTALATAMEPEIQRLMGE